jgi:RNA polymerase sigma-70 factor (ECF subfamily)
MVDDGEVQHHDEFAAFFREHYGEVLRSVAVALGDRDRAEDVTQEAFARACRRWRSVSAMEKPVAWVYVVALNAERTRWRREQRRPDDPAAEVLDPSGAVLDALTLEVALDALTPRQRAVVVLRYLADLSTTDVAAVMGCAPGTVKATLHQALARLRVDLDGSEG